MKGTITYLEMNDVFKDSKGREWDCAILRIDPEPVKGQKREEREYRVFPGTDVYEKLRQFKTGDYVDLKMVRRGRFWDIGDISHATYPGGPGGLNNSGNGNTIVKVEAISEDTLNKILKKTEELALTWIAAYVMKSKIKSYKDVTDLYQDVRGELSGPQPGETSENTEEDVPF